ncbi:MAG: CHAT domain-containing protein [Candidatus Thiosymbion ectosymbiont of Robbea hypermnestra]|nr:CHAT domain-containing protein [Candidatus Thiosymbion ectosymbiont of Robbea hypermnestra]
MPPRRRFGRRGRSSTPTSRPPGIGPWRSTCSAPRSRKNAAIWPPPETCSNPPSPSNAPSSAVPAPGAGPSWRWAGYTPGRALGAGSRDLVLRRAFTVPAVHRRDLTAYRYISFATHGVLPSKLECLPDAALITTPGPGSGPAAAGLLLASEVATKLKMDADLVVLSACDTGGGGKESGGEALSGLARNFFYAGARNLLVSHWEVPSLTTLELLVRTFEKLSRGGQTVADALRHSQLDIIKTGSYSHPKAWAGFTLVGHGG